MKILDYGLAAHYTFTYNKKLVIPYSEIWPNKISVYANVDIKYNGHKIANIMASNPTYGGNIEEIKMYYRFPINMEDNEFVNASHCVSFKMIPENADLRSLIINTITYESKITSDHAASDFQMVFAQSLSTYLIDNPIESDVLSRSIRDYKPMSLGQRIRNLFGTKR